MTNDIGSESPSLIDRAKAMIIRPSEEWNTIAREDSASRDILIGYVLPLALITPVCGFIGGYVFGYYPLGVLPGIVTAAIAYFFSVISLLALTLIADSLSPRFGGEANYLQSFKLLAYSSTAIWLAGIFTLAPVLRPLGVFGLYSIYLLYSGAKPVLNIPANKALVFTFVILICAILLIFMTVWLSAMNIELLRAMGIITAELPRPTLR